MEILTTKQVAPVYMSPAQAASRYSLCRTSIYELMLLPGAPLGLKIGSRRLLPVNEWDKFIAAVGSKE